MAESEHPHGHKRLQREKQGAKSEIKVTAGHMWMSLRCHFLTKAFQY